MGKFQSKIASKRRQSPEGGALASNVLTCQGELKRNHRTKLTQNLYVELRENRLEHKGKRSVVLPLKKTNETEKSIYIKINKQIRKRKGHAGVSDTECHTALEEESQQEWVFTLYDYDSRGKVTKEDMFSLIHSLHEVIEALVKQPGHTPVRIKLAVSPTACSDVISQTAPEKSETPERKLYSVDENIERRNHYLDLAGIENYTSKFDSSESPSQEPTQHAHSALQNHTVVGRGNCISNASPCGLSGLHSLKKKSTSLRKDRSTGEGKSYSHPASWCRLTPTQPPAHSALQRSHSKRLRSRVHDASSYSRPTPGRERETLSNCQPCCGVPLVQKHEHYHHHEHHHHHHHHH